MKKAFLLLFMFTILLSCANCSLGAGTPVDMVYVPAAYSMMGAEMGDLSAESNTKPYHLVYLDAFYMDVHEVTNADYAVCVAAGKCRELQETASKTRTDYYTNPMYAYFPVVNVTWQDAQDYCAFVEKRLPSEAEWERAARGAEDNRRYPWGNGSPKAANINISKIPGDTERVNIYASGLSPYGCADMMGNVSEWVSDWYAENWYQYCEQENPSGPAAGTQKTVRGSSYETVISELHSASRFGWDPDSYSSSIGFRCALGIRESVRYDVKAADGSVPDEEFAYIKAGNENGIFLLAEPGTGYDTALICVIPNGAVVEILAGPVNINYSDWYQIKTQKGEIGWTLASAIVLTK